MPTASLAPRSTATLTTSPALFALTSRAVSFPTKHVVFAWDRLIAKRPLAFETLNAMPSYLLKPEGLALINSEPDPRYRFKERVQSYLWAGQFKKDDKLFPHVRQTVTRRIHKLVERAGARHLK